MKNISQEIESTELDVVRKGPKFMEKEGEQPRGGQTMDNLNLLQNIFAAQSRARSPGKSRTAKPARRPAMKSLAVQTDLNADIPFEPPLQAANVQHYKP